MNSHRPARPRSIVLGVTSTQSLRLMEGFPEYLVSRGWEVHVVCSDPPAAERKNWTLHSIPMRRNPSPLRDLHSLLRWIILLVNLRPSIVAAGTPKAGLLGTLAALLTLRPTRIYTLRGLRLSTVRGVERWLLYVLEKLTMFSATQVHAVSASLAQEAVSLGLTSPAKLTVLGAGSSNGVTVPPLEETLLSKGACREELGLHRAPTVGYVGRLHPDKGIDVLLEAMGLIKEVPDKQLLIVGGEDVPGYMERLLATSEVDPAELRCVGSVTNPTKYYPAMDVLCLPTKREGFPNVILEAAAYGVPSIAARVTGCIDAVVDGVTGYLTAPDDPQALADALESALTDLVTIAELGAKARSRVEVEFPRERVWRATESFYRAQLVRNHASGAQATTIQGTDTIK